jgi:hypothetical protein
MVGGAYIPQILYFKMRGKRHRGKKILKRRPFKEYQMQHTTAN